MPHIIVKLWTGKSEAQKSAIAQAITQAIMASANSTEKSISVSIEDFAPKSWAEKVYKPDILAKPENLYKKPGYQLE